MGMHINDYKFHECVSNYFKYDLSRESYLKQLESLDLTFTHNINKKSAQINIKLMKHQICFDRFCKMYEDNKIDTMKKVKLIKLMLKTQNFILECITEYQSLADEYMGEFFDQDYITICNHNMDHMNFTKDKIKALNQLHDMII